MIEESRIGKVFRHNITGRQILWPSHKTNKKLDFPPSYLRLEREYTTCSKMSEALAILDPHTTERESESTYTTAPPPHVSAKVK